MHISRECIVLIVEDDEPKLKAISSAVLEVDTHVRLLFAGSVASAVALISAERIDIAILDMSLPAYDISSDLSGGGQPQGFGGKDILSFLEDIQPEAKALIVTQYEEFKTTEGFPEVKKFASISTELMDEYASILVDVLYYSGQRGAWRERLKRAFLKCHGVAE